VGLASDPPAAPDSDDASPVVAASGFSTRTEALAAPLAAIDIGTNSFHLVVAQPTVDHRFEIIDREKEMVRLGSGSGDMKRLEPEAIDRGVHTLTRFRQIAESAGAWVTAVATSAVREAENRDEFLERAARDAGVHVEVISGAEEARLIYLGVLQAVPVNGRRLLLVDIGGGSTEFVLGEGTQILEAQSLKLGAIRLTERFLRREPLRKRDVADCRNYVRAYLTHPVRQIRDLGFDVTVGSSGTIINLAEMVHALRSSEPLRTVSNYTFNAEDLQSVVSSLVSARTVEDRSAVPGLDPKRADIILGGAIVLAETFEEFGIEEMTVSDYALREGVLLDALRRSERASLGHLEDLRRQSVLRLAAIAPGERAHAEHSTRLALELFGASRDLHQLPEVCGEWLEAAGLLCNVGLFVSHDRHHLHSYYVIRNSDLLVGFTDHEIEIIAQVARYHRKSPPRARHREFALLPEDDQETVRKLAGILRIAIALDRTRAGVTSGLTFTRDGKRVTITVDTRGRDASLELYTADARKGLFEEALGVQVDFALARAA
jgi:exopolyphosphatase/guanosine-5'-triphosphate,3'-diphosphate pyrophosphatase